MTKETILKRLQAGESADAIAEEMAEVINAAVAEKKALDEAKRKEEEEKAWQLKDADAVAALLNDYLKKYCGGSGSDITGEALVGSSNILSKMINLGDNIQATAKQTVRTPDGKTKTTVKTGQEAVDWVEEAFSDFFKAFGL